jgi:hypothetical protein
LWPLSRLFQQASSSSSIYRSYDWVSETVVDKSGNRLILPGPLIDLDASVNGNDNYFEHHCETQQGSRSTCLIGYSGLDEPSGGTLIVPASPEPSNRPSDIARPTSCCDLVSSVPSSWWPSTTIMVSAHDLLAVKRQQRLQDQFWCQESEMKRSPPSSSCCWIDSEDEQHGEGCMLGISNRALPWATNHIISSETSTQEWTHAFWKIAKRKTSTLFGVKCFSTLQQTVQSVERVLSVSLRLFIKRHRGPQHEHVVDNPEYSSQIEECLKQDILPSVLSTTYPCFSESEVSINETPELAAETCEEGIIMIELTPWKRNEIYSPSLNGVDLV